MEPVGQCARLACLVVVVCVKIAVFIVLLLATLFVVNHVVKITVLVAVNVIVLLALSSEVLYVVKHSKFPDCLSPPKVISGSNGLSWMVQRILIQLLIVLEILLEIGILLWVAIVCEGTSKGGRDWEYGNCPSRRVIDVISYSKVIVDIFITNNNNSYNWIYSAIT